MLCNTPTPKKIVLLKVATSLLLMTMSLKDLLLAGLLSLCLVQGLVPPGPVIAKPSALQQMQKNLFKQMLPIVLSSVLLTDPSSAFDPTVYNHSYKDPFHPLCKRRVEVSADGKTFDYRGTAVGPKDDPVLRGCSQKEIKEYGLRFGQFSGQILKDGRISAGDGIHEGVWEPAGSVSPSSGLKHTDVTGIRWNDGNKWIVIEPGFGEFITYGYISLSLAAGAFGIVRTKQQKEQEV